MRVSTVLQNGVAQRDALLAAGVPEENIYADEATGSAEGRPQFDELLSKMQRGDRLTIWKLDRMGRSLKHLIELAEHYRENGIELRILTEQCDTSTPHGRLVFHVTGAMAEFERDMNHERTMAALAAARTRGRRGGRRSKITPGQAELVIRLHYEGQSHGQISENTQISRAAVGRLIRNEVPSLLDSTQAAHARYSGSAELPPS